MTTSKDMFADWDAAYILGALSPADRHAFEEHLAECESCSSAVGEIAGIPGLLARVPGEQIEELMSPDRERDQRNETAPDSLPALLAAARSRRRRSRGWMVSLTVAAAAAAAVLALVIPNLLAPHPGVRNDVASVSMAQVVPSPLSADIRLISEPWGTRIESTCRYLDGPSSSSLDWPDTAGTYALVVTDRSGHTTQVSTWWAKPGSTVEPTATTNLAVDEIASVEIRSMASGQTLLRTAFD